jgi:hypothetical protein
MPVCWPEPGFSSLIFSHLGWTKTQDPHTKNINIPILLYGFNFASLDMCSISEKFTPRFQCPTLNLHTFYFYQNLRPNIFKTHCSWLLLLIYVQYKYSVWYCPKFRLSAASFASRTPILEIEPKTIMPHKEALHNYWLHFSMPFHSDSRKILLKFRWVFLSKAKTRLKYYLHHLL